MDRRQFMLKAQIDRYKWAKQVDPKAVSEFEALAAQRKTDGARKK